MPRMLLNRFLTVIFHYNRKKVKNTCPNVKYTLHLYKK